MTAQNNKPYNILFIFTDQERQFENYPLALPGRERLRQEGVTFMQHQINTTVCSPSRSVVYTGRHVQRTKVWDNVTVPWQKDLSKGIPTIGKMMQEVGYYSVYLGKWHLSKPLSTYQTPFDTDVKALNEEIRQYGFNDYFGPGDLIGGVHGGFEFDGITLENAIYWLRHRTNTINNTNAKQHDNPNTHKPWFMALNLVNPHDVMFTNTDGTHALDTINQTHDSAMIVGNGKPPKHKLYEKTWEHIPLDPTRHEPYDAPARPMAHRIFYQGRSNLVGTFPISDERLRIYQDNYFNCMRDSDRHIVRLMQELEELDLLDNTIIIMTSDHGDLMGAHHLVGKGATAYREQNHVPMIVRHPQFAHSAGQRCGALTCHLDIVPTLLEFAGLDESARQTLHGKIVNGKSFAKLLDQPADAAFDAVRPSSLYSYGMFLYFDNDWVLAELTLLRRSGLPEPELEKRVMANQPDFSLRGMIRSIRTEKYRFSRYFSPLNFNTPATLDELLTNNDVELYDLQADPCESNNLAADPNTHANTLMLLNQQLNALIVEEVGEESISNMPIVNGKIWVERYANNPEFQ